MMSKEEQEAKEPHELAVLMATRWVSQSSGRRFEFGTSQRWRVIVLRIGLDDGRLLHWQTRWLDDDPSWKVCQIVRDSIREIERLALVSRPAESARGA